MKTIGIMRDIGAVHPVTRREMSLKAGEVYRVPDDVFNGIRQKHAGSTVNLTPGPVASIYGIFVPERHARFWTVPCPVCGGGKPRMSACRLCRDTKRVVVA
jgi:hypothetical protein